MTTKDKLPYSEEVILEAKKMYMQSISYNQTAKIIREKTGKGCTASLVKKWSDDRGWPEERSKMLTKINQVITGRTMDTLLKRAEDQIDMYQKMQKKGKDALADDTVTVDKMGDAISLIDTGIKGERQISSGLVSWKYIELVVSIIAEEVKDEDTKRRIAQRIQKATENILSL